MPVRQPQPIPPLHPPGLFLRAAESAAVSSMVSYNLKEPECSDMAKRSGLAMTERCTTQPCPTVLSQAQRWCACQHPGGSEIVPYVLHMPVRRSTCWYDAYKGLWGDDPVLPVASETSSGGGGGAQKPPSSASSSLKYGWGGLAATCVAGIFLMAGRWVTLGVN